MSTLSKIQSELELHQLDGIIIESPYNRRYLTNFTGTAGVVLITRNEKVLITDFRYSKQAKIETAEFTIIEAGAKSGSKTQIEVISDLVKKLNIQKLGFEEEFVSFKEYNQLKMNLDVQLIPTSNIVENHRKLKSADEVDKIRKAAAIADKAFSKILNDIKPGVSEMDIRNKFEMYVREEGGVSTSFEMIVASGHRSALPHGRATEKKIEVGDMFTLDFGALYQGYRSDVTRTVAVGEPSPELKEIYEIVYNALELSIQKVQKGALCEHVDSAARDYITSNGYGKNFGHGIGHGVGLEVHEIPFMGRRKGKLSPGMVVTVEPGIYIENLGGVRIEDMVLVTEEGNEVLSHSPKELIIL